MRFDTHSFIINCLSTIVARLETGNTAMHYKHTAIGRRSFVCDGVFVLGALAANSTKLLGDTRIDHLQFALVTDLHYADKPSAGTRHYRQTLDKLQEAAEQFARDKPTFIVELGDLIDAADSIQTELAYLATVNREFAAIGKDRIYVLGNHCVNTLRKQEFLEAVGQEKSYFSFDRQGVHFIVLDGCFRSDGEPYERKNFKWDDANIPTEELEWLQADLAACTKPAIVLTHQRLDVTKSHSVKNHAEVRRVLEASEKVLAVFQGHSHDNELQELNGIHYCTMVAMVEGADPSSSGYSLISIQPDSSIHVTGFRRQHSHQWPAARN